MNEFHNKKLTKFSQNLRSEATREENHLWYDFLKLLPQTVHRQKIIGEYIVDFYCASAKIVIELDGSQHGTIENREKDKQRDEHLLSLGIKVLRYTNADINYKFDSVCKDILKQIEERTI